MRKQLRKWLGMSFLAACLWSGQSMMAQSVIFPQEKQAGLAGLVVEQGAYTLQNELLKAKFVVKDNHLFLEEVRNWDYWAAQNCLACCWLTDAKCRLRPCK